MNEEILAGGVANPSAVVRVGDRVRRPAPPHARLVHRLLNHLRDQGFESSVPLELSTDHEVLSFVPGDVPIPPYPDWALTDSTLASVGALMRSFHETVATFPYGDVAEWSDELRDPVGAEIVCHNDVCLENVVFRDGRAVAFLDFDYAAPGRRIWDLALAAGMCVPLRPPEDPLPGQSTFDPVRRFRVLVEAYGLATHQHEEFVDAIVESKRVGSAFVRRNAEAGGAGFIAMLAERGRAFERQLEWLIANRDTLLEALST